MKSGPSFNYIHIKNGYTLIELLVVITVLSVVAVTGMNLFFSTLVGNNKEAAMRQIKQDGEYAITKMETDFRSAKAIDPCTTGMTQVKLLLLNGNYLIYWVNNGRIVLDGDENYVTSDNNRVVDGQLHAECRVDAGSGNTYLEVSFTLATTELNPLKSNEKFSQEFKTSVALRNK